MDRRAALAASSALSTTRRLSSTQQSEYANAVIDAGTQRAVTAAADAHAARCAQRAAAAEIIVEEQAEADLPARPQAGHVRQDELHRPDDVRGDAQQALALDQRFAHQAELEEFEIAQAAVDQLGAGGRSGGGEIRLLDQRDFQPAARGVARDAGAVDAAAHDEKIDAVAGRHANLLKCSDEPSAGMIQA